MRGKTSITTEDGGNYALMPDMRNGMLVWREVK